MIVSNKKGIVAKQGNEIFLFHNISLSGTMNSIKNGLQLKSKTQVAATQNSHKEEFFFQKKKKNPIIQLIAAARKRVQQKMEETFLSGKTRTQIAHSDNKFSRSIHQLPNEESSIEFNRYSYDTCI